MSAIVHSVRWREFAAALAAVQARLSVNVERTFGSVGNACDQMRSRTVPDDVIIGCPL